MNLQQVLVANGYLSLPACQNDNVVVGLEMGSPEVATIVRNSIYYGYVPSLDCVQRLASLDEAALITAWRDIETAFKELTADNRKMDDFVVYQNFPQEVLEMSEAEYWTKQILMYFGFDKELFRQEPQERSPLSEKTNLKVLHLADEDTPTEVYSSLVKNPSRWTAPQAGQVTFLVAHLNVNVFEMSQAGFRENGIHLVNYLLDNRPDSNVVVQDATDVLRLAALRSGGDASLRQKFKFKSFSRRERRFLCELLEGSKHLEADIAERQGLWKRFLKILHPGDHGCKRVSAAYDALYNGRLRSYASRIETGIQAKNPEVFALLQARPGEFRRRLHKLYSVFGEQAILAFSEVMDKLSNQQLLQTLKYAESINSRATLAYPPRRNWNKLQVKPNNKQPFTEEVIATLRANISALLKHRLMETLSEGVSLDERASWIKLQTNDQELANYGRGTVFQIPENMRFLRSASYWENSGNTSWFDNGWNFFDGNWKALGACCWNTNTFATKAAIFSGDPVNAKELKGRACQMIDLYIDRLLEAGVRYAVWNVLCYSHIKFSQVSGEVVATLQWGEQPEKGKLYEPSRAQMVFPLTGDNLTKYVAYVDLQERKLVYMDANLRGKVHSAASNGTILSEQMPAFVDYLNSLPSVADLFEHADEGSIPILYSDAEQELRDEQPAYVFRPENQDSSYSAIDLSKLL